MKKLPSDTRSRDDSIHAEDRKVSPLTARFIQTHPGDAAQALQRTGSVVLIALVGSLPAKLAAGLVRHLLPFAGAQCLAALDPDRAVAIVRHLPVDSGAVLIRGLDSQRREEIITRMPPASALALRLLLRARPGTVGAIADPEVMSLSRQMRAGEVKRLARKSPWLLRKYLYVLDASHRLIGTVDTRTCLLAAKDIAIEQLMQTDPIALRAGSTLAEALEHAAWTRFDLLPVVDRGGRFLGVLRRAGLAASVDQDAALPAAFGDTLISLADLYWRGSASIFLSGQDRSREGTSD